MKKTLAISVVLLCATVLICIATITMHKEKTHVKNCYKNNQNTFDTLADTFSKLYASSLKQVYYEYDTDTIKKCYEDNMITSDNDIDFIRESLSELQEKYQNDASHRAFSYIKSYYDDSGNMLMYFKVKSERFKRGSDDKIRYHYLVYIDEAYHGNDSDLSIDTFEINTEPFSGNWYYYSADSLIS